MSIFPAKILLATDGSDEAELALVTAVDMATSTDSELYVVHVGAVPAFLENYSGTLGYARKFYEELEVESREVLRKLTWQVEVAGGSVDGTHFRMGTVALEIVSLAKELGAGLIVMGCGGAIGDLGGSSRVASPLQLYAMLPAPYWWCVRTRATKVPGHAPSSMWAAGERSRMDNATIYREYIRGDIAPTEEATVTKVALAFVLLGVLHSSCSRRPSTT